MTIYPSRVRAGLLEQRHEQELQDDAQQQRLRVEVSFSTNVNWGSVVFYSIIPQSLVVSFKRYF